MGIDFGKFRSRVSPSASRRPKQVKDTVYYAGQEKVEDFSLVPQPTQVEADGQRDSLGAFQA